MNINELYSKTKETLTKAGIENPAFNSMSIITDTLNISYEKVVADGRNIYLNEEQVQNINNKITKRANKEPLQYIIGNWTFMDINIKVGKGVLIPRDDTEVVVNSTLNYLKKVSAAIPSPIILDLCSGSGAIALAIKKKFPNTKVIAIEKSKKAYTYLLKNIKNNNLNVMPINDDILTCYNKFKDNSIDLIISNPPYIKTSHLKTLQEEVRHEPKLALDGGTDGYYFYNAIIKNWSSKLKPDAMLALELGENQYNTVYNLMKDYNFINIKDFYDFSNIQRAINGTRFAK